MMRYVVNMRLLAVLAVPLLVMACSRSQAPATQRSASEEKPSEPADGGHEMAFKLTTEAFDAGARIPKKHTGEGEDVSPALTWDALPDGTAELALICDDPDAPREEPWVHWVIYKLPAELGSLSEGMPQERELTNPAGVLQGVNSWPDNNIGYRGPMPPEGHGVHHYHFKLFALDTKLEIHPGATKAELLKAMDGHVLAEAELIGTYER